MPLLDGSWVILKLTHVIRTVFNVRRTTLPASKVANSLVFGSLAAFAGFFLWHELRDDSNRESELRKALKALLNRDDDIDQQLAGAQYIVKYLESDKSKDKETRSRCLDNHAIYTLVKLLKRHANDELRVELEDQEDKDTQNRVLVQALRALRLVVKVGAQGRTSVAKQNGLRVVTALLFSDQFSNAVKIEAARTLKSITKFDFNGVEFPDIQEPAGSECCKQLPRLPDGQYETLFDYLKPNQDREIIRGVCSALANSSFIRAGALELSACQPLDVILPLLGSPVEGIRRAAVICVGNVARFDWNTEENRTFITQASTIKAILPLVRDSKKRKVQLAVLHVLSAIFFDDEFVDNHAIIAKILTEDKTSTQQIFRLLFNNFYDLRTSSTRLCNKLQLVPGYEDYFRTMAREARNEFVRQQQREKEEQMRQQQQMQMAMMQQMGMGGGEQGGIPPEYLQMMMAGGAGGGMPDMDDMME